MTTTTKSSCSLSKLQASMQPLPFHLQITTAISHHITELLKHMEKHRYGFSIILLLVISLGLVSFISCMIAESKKAKIKDLKLDNKLCYVPGTPAFGYGIASLICLIIAQIVANLVICGNYLSSSENRISAKDMKPETAATTLLILSWVSFGLAAVLLSAATSMSRTQSYGRGWLDGQCYLVKDGVYTSSGVLVLINITSIVGSAVFVIRRLQVDQKGEKLNERI